MGRKDSLSCFEKRDLLNQTAASVETLVEWGRRFEEQEMWSDAVDFYMKANAGEELKRLMDRVREEGDSFLFGRICKALGYEPTPSEWLSVADQADRLGKHSLAVQARRRAGIEMEDAPVLVSVTVKRP